MDFICSQPNFLKNPNGKPLNELRLEAKIIKRKRRSGNDKNINNAKLLYDVNTEKIPALHQHWIQAEHSYQKYQPYYTEVAKEENDLFISMNKLLLENLNFLLQRTYHQFWNYIIYEPRVTAMLRSFLYNGMHPHELKYLDEDQLNLYCDIFIKVLNVYLRMLNPKESNIEFMSEDTMIKLIETHKLIDYIDIINLFRLYSKSNRRFISKIQNLFFDEKHTVTYTREINRTINQVLLVFEMVGGQICGFEENAVIIPVGIRSRPQTFDPFWVEEVAAYLLDTAVTLNSLLENCPTAGESSMSLGLPYRLTFFYNQVCPALYQMMDNRSFLDSERPDLKIKILENIAVGRKELVNSFHSILTSLTNDIVQNIGDQEKQDSALETYLSLISAALEDEMFIIDYHNAHHIDIQFQMLADLHPRMDPMRVNYILECLSTLPTLEELNVQKVQNSELTFALPNATVTHNDAINYNEWTSEHVLTENEILDFTKQVMDTLPHLGDGFIRECLKVYNYNTADVISAILDENLPTNLSNLPRGLVYVPPEPEPEQPIMAYRGKRPDYKDTTELLDDKTELEEVKKFVLKTSVSFDMYDDEYDDRYDDEPVLKFYDKTDDVNMYEDMRNRFEGYELVSDPSDSSSDEEVAVSTKSKDVFCEDPALIRARREAGRNNRGRSHDVVGKAKGQGQDKNVLHNREKKNINKSSRANHNRKGGAQWKRNKGMIPS